MIKDSAYWIRKLGLEPHPEGGYYRQTYRADLVLEGLPHQFSGSRAASTAIYFLLEGENFCAFHLAVSDELALLPWSAAQGTCYRGGWPLFAGSTRKRSGSWRGIAGGGQSGLLVCFANQRWRAVCGGWVHGRSGV